MHLADKQGNTKYDLLSKFSKKTGKTHPDLVFPDLDEMAMYLWEWFQELNSQRTSNGFGQNPITFLDIQAWANLTKRFPLAWEVKAIRTMDSMWLSEIAKNRDSQTSDTKLK
jgi:hypothetical protein